MREKSGVAWVSRYPGSKSVDLLEPSFRRQFVAFLTALQASTAKIEIIATLRPPERAYLMHWCYRIARQNAPADKVPPMPEVNIDWWHGDQALSVLAAKEMDRAYGLHPNLSTPPALRSRHTDGKAVDMTVRWTGVLEIKDSSGKEVKISTTPRESINKELIAVAKTFGVIHFLQADKDPGHWSVDGR